MGDDHGQHPGPGSRPSHGRATGSSVLTPPTGLTVVPDETVVPDDPRALVDDVPAPAPSARPVAAPPQTAVAPCLCGHGADAHRHWRRGTDCGTCGLGTCTIYRPRGGVVRRLLRGVRLVH
jgi:hypothetical protein